MVNQNILVAAAVVGLGGLMYMDGLKPRGILNNNPLNIRDNKNNNWQGKIGVDDKQFVVFSAPEYGYRAAAKLLSSYNRRGIKTLSDIITTWSPPQGIDADGNSYTNPTDSYIRGVSQKTGIAPNEIVNKNDYNVLFMAMTYHENGVMPYTNDVIQYGINLADV